MTVGQLQTAAEGRCLHYNTANIYMVCLGHFAQFMLSSHDVFIIDGLHLKGRFLFLFTKVTAENPHTLQLFYKSFLGN